VLTFAAPVLREPSRDNAIIQALAAEFPNVVSRPIGASGAPNASLVLASSSAQLSIGPGQAEFGVGFSEPLLSNRDQVIDYLRTKLGTVVAALHGLDVNVLTAGVVLLAQYSFGSESSAGVLRQLLETQIRGEVPVDDVADVQVRLALKVSDTYYVSLMVNNYETRNFQRIASPASPVISIRPWEGEVTDLGIQLAIDVNNRLGVRQAESDTVLGVGGMGDILDVVAAVAADTGPSFLERGRISSAEIEAALGASQ
jgi:hypothetical protein